MRILVDADACPVKQIIVRLAKERNIHVTMLIDTSHQLDDGYSEVITVDKQADSVDFSLMGLLAADDVVVTQDAFEIAKTALSKKKPELDLSKARLIKTTEGLCVQAMHIGSYDDEPATIAAMEKYATENGYTIDISDTRRHHEIYLSDPRKTSPEKLKTVIRHPIKQHSKRRINGLAYTE